MRPHPNIVRFYDAWMEPAARPEGAEHCFIWLEKCGETVGQRVRCGGDPFTEPELLELLKQVTSRIHPSTDQNLKHWPRSRRSELRLRRSPRVMSQVWSEPTI